MSGRDGDSRASLGEGEKTPGAPGGGYRSLQPPLNAKDAPHFHDGESDGESDPGGNRGGGSPIVGGHSSQERAEGGAAAAQQPQPAVMSYIRDDWVCKQMLAREEEFTAFQKTSIFVGTFNANGKKPTETLEAWLLGPKSSPYPMSDIYVIGFQEIVDLNATNVVLETQSSSRTNLWGEKIHNTLNSAVWAKEHPQGGSFDTEEQDNRTPYELISKNHLVGIALLIYVARRHVPYVRGVLSKTAGVGLMGMMGNKGACAVRMKYYDSTLCFISSHLAAHRGNVQGRNADYAHILDKVAFKHESSAAGKNLSTGAPISTFHKHGYYGIADHDYVFWAGDLNYRIASGVTVEQCYQRIREGDFDYLRSQDQLNQERAAGRTFVGFEEGVVSFLPTYKYIPGTDRYDDREDKKMRAPAWCDRVLWRIPPGVSQKASNGILRVNLRKYDRCSTNKISDHKPVLALFDVQIKTTIRKRQREVYGEIMRALDAWENDCIPKVTMDTNVLFFKDVKYRVRREQFITVKNDGQVRATFRFVPKLEEDNFCKPWLSVDPPYAMLLPEQSMKIRVTVYVDGAVANGLHLGRESLDDIMIMRLEKGRDHFVSISGSFARSCFGSDLSVLLSATKPMRLQEIGELEKNRYLTIPKEVWRLVDVIHDGGNGLHTVGLFVESGSPEEIALIREALDTGESLPTASPHSVAEALLQLLGSLVNPIVPPEMWPRTDFDSANKVSQWSR